MAKMKKTSIIGEFWGFLKTRKKWWLFPVLLFLLLLALILIAAPQAVAPFIYTLF
jgi:hypothetical protein